MGMKHATKREEVRVGNRPVKGRSKPLATVAPLRGQVYSLVAVLIAIPLFLFIAFYMTSSQTIKSEVM